ncbi:AAA family ATPase [Rhodobacteraceae bacterium KMM 6894]|nr:AAA family ATPase [Rhodobacteraceae bacterium KMM 6894]
MQDVVIAFLKSPDWQSGGGPVEVVQTHGALIFLGDTAALKIKRAVKYDYMDFSTLDRRKAMLLRELDLNRPTAPEIYRDVVPVTRQADGHLALDGDGTPVEWVLRMWRFPNADELATIAETRGIDDTLARDLGAVVFDYHAQAPQRDADGATGIRDILDGLDRSFATMTVPLGAGAIDRFHHDSRAMLDRVAGVLRQRAATGHVRRCHGDLHLGNLVLVKDRPVPFDALEFDEALGTCDVLYDLAFLIMDLLHRAQDRAANIALNAYLLAAKGGEDDGLAALPLFLAIRAAIRAMVSVQTTLATGTPPNNEAERYLQAAVAFLRPEPASLVLIGGLSGTGKTAVSRALAPSIGPPPGAVHLRTDLERKVMHDKPAEDRLTAEAYTSAARQAVYHRMFARAERILGAGQSVLLDATFLDPACQADARLLADKSKVALRALWLDAPLPVLLDRVRARQRDASDADETVVQQQVKTCQPPAGWRIVSAAGPLDDTVRQARLAL